MLGKNNFNERLRKMELQAKQDRFSIRKLSIGAASILLGFTFFGLNSQNVKADTVTPKTQASQTNSSSQSNLNKSDKNNVAHSVKKSTEKKAELSTFSGLSSFLKDDSADTHFQGTESAGASEDKTAETDSPSAITKPDKNSDKQSANSDAKDTGKEANASSHLEANTDQSKKAEAKALDNVAQVTDWKTFTAALKDAKIQEIQVMNDIVSTVEGGANYIYFPGRKLVIKSGGDGSSRHYIDFRGNSPYVRVNTVLDLTYENITLYSADYYGVIDTVAATQSTPAKITFRNVDFHGSQLVYCGSHTHIYFEGTNFAETIYAPYLPGSTVPATGTRYTAFTSNNQQLFEFTGRDNSIDFNGTFIGTTFAGNVIQMNGNNNTVNIHKGANVTLNPGKTYVSGKGPRGPWHANQAETTQTIYGIIMMGSRQNLNVDGILNINVGQNDTYKGTYDDMVATAIRLDQSSSTITIGSNAQVNVNTNGDIAQALNYDSARNLIYNGGKVLINPSGALNVTGQNMGDYSGTLVMIKGTANIQNGAFNIRLLNDPNDPDNESKGAGTGAIKLVDVQGGTLIVNNPTSLVLDAHLNKNRDTSIIGNNAINITNVRQQLKIDTDNGQSYILNLPPFHQLEVRKTNRTISVENMILLNGQRKFSQEQLKELQKNPAISKLIDAYPGLKDKLASYVNKAFDEIFTDVIQLAFSNEGNPGYNNIHFIPANPSGFLDIDPSSIRVDLNEDGSRTVHGKVLNYDPQSDGPDSDGIFSTLLPGGTNAYIIAHLMGSKEGQIWVDPKINDNPYGETNDTSLPNQFAARVNDDGSFSFTIPADQTIKLAKNDKIKLTPNANFVGYNPLQQDRPVIADLQILTLAEAQAAAAAAINNAVADAKAKKPANLTEKQSAAFDQAINDVAQVAENPGEKAKSVYGAETIVEVNRRKREALRKITEAFNLAVEENALEVNKAEAINRLKAEAKSQIDAYPSLADKITSARDTAIEQVSAVTINSNNLEEVTNNGIVAIDQAAKDYKNQIKEEINNKITELENDITNIASDTNLAQKEVEAINALKDGPELTDAKQIAQNDGDIDRDTSEGTENDPFSVEGHKKTANDQIQNVRNKIDAIKKLEEAAKEQIRNHIEDSAAIKDALNKGVDNILNGTDPDGSKGITSINQVHADQQANDINTAAELAKERVQNSGLSPEEQETYLTAIDNAAKAVTAKPGTAAYDESKSLYGTTDEAEVQNRKEKALNTFNKEAAKAEIVGYAKASENDLQIVSDNDIEQTIEAGKSAVDSATSVANITAAEEAAKKNILKATSKKKLADVKAEVEDKISNISGLSANEIEEAKLQADKLVDNLTAPLGYNQQIQQAEAISDINSLREDGITALNNLVTEQTAKGKRNNAIADATEKIRDKQKEANAIIDAINGLTDQQKEGYHQQINDAANQGIQELQGTDTADIDGKTTSINNNIDNIVNGAQNEAARRIKAAQDAATDAINKAAQAAKDKIDQIPDDQLSKSNKKYYKDQIDQHAKTASDRISAAQDETTITSNQKEGEVNINRDLNDAQISAARSKAIKDLQEARANARKVISDAHDLGIIDDTVWENKINKVDDYYDQATGVIAGDHTIPDIQTHAKNGIDAIKGVSDSISHDKEVHDLAVQRQKAIDALNQAAQDVYNHISKDPNLSAIEKNKYYNQITDAVNQGKQAIQSADKNNVDKELAAGKDALNKIQSDADLQSAKDKALVDLYNEQNTINRQIDGMTTLTSDSKTKLREQVKAAYDAATNNIKNGQLATIADITAAKNQGINNIDNVINDININKIINQQKLDDYANQAINRIQNATDITDDVKHKTIESIEKARDEAKQAVENKENIADSNTAEKNGEIAIDKAEAQGNGLDTAKATAIKNIKAAAENAKKRLKDSYNKLSPELTPEEKAQLLQDIQDASNMIQSKADDAEDRIKQETNKEQVNNIYKDTINAIADSEAQVNLEIDKLTAQKEIEAAAAAAKNSLTDPSDKAAVDDVANLGKHDIDVATVSETVGKIKDNTLQSIQNIKDIANSKDAQKIREQKRKAIDALNKELGSKTDGTGVLGDIEKLPNLSAEEKAKFQQQAQDAHDRAVAAVQGAAKDDIDTEKNSGIIKIDQALVAAQLQSAKNKAKEELDQAAADAIAKDPNDKNEIESERDKGKESIDQAEDINSVNIAKGKGQSAINGIVDTAKNESLKAEKQAAEEELDNDADRLKQQINEDYQHKKLSQDQYEKLINKVNQAVEDGKTKINAATTQERLNNVKNQNDRALADIAAEVSEEESLTAAMNKLQAAADQANAKADEIAKNDAQLGKDMKDEIESERAKAAKNIQTAKNSGNNPNESMNQAAADGVSAIEGLSERFEAKNRVINELKQYAQNAKSELDGMKLDNNEINQGEQDINNALNNGISEIYQADNSADLSELETEIKQNIDHAKLPSKLLSEKNKQLAAIDDYVNSKGDIAAIASDLTPEQKQDLQNQLAQVIKNTKDKINNVNLPNNPTDTDLANAISKITNAEKGIAENNETTNFGETGVDTVYQLAKDRERIYQIKQEGIHKLEEAKDDADRKIENSGLSSEDQAKQKQKVQEEFDRAKEDINRLPETNDIQDKVNDIVDRAKNVLNDITKQVKLDGAKTTAENALKDKQNEAHQIIAQSQLTADQKQKANQQIDTAYNDALAEIENQTDISNIPSSSADIGQKIDQVWKDSTWVSIEKDNANNGAEGVDGLESELNNLTEKQKNNPDYAGYINEINSSITAIKQAQNIKDASQAYDKGITALNKLKAKDEIDQALNQAQKEIDNNQDLDQQTKDNLKDKAKEHADAGKQKIDKVIAPAGDVNAKRDKINQLRDEAKGDIQSEVNQALEVSKNKADREVADKHQEAVDKLHEEFGPDAETSQVDHAFEQHKHISGNSYEEIQHNKLEAEKEIGKGAVDDAANNAKNKVDNNEGKHANGTDLTDEEKEIIKNEIDKAKENAKNNIDHATSPSAIDNDRDNAIHQMHQNGTDPATIDNIINQHNNSGSGAISSDTGSKPDDAKKPVNNGQGSGNNSGQGIDVDLSKSKDFKLMHNAYLYDQNGRRTNKVIIGAGSIITTYGVKTINGHDYYVLVDQGNHNKLYYLAIGNVNSVSQKLKHNAYVYNQHGKRVKKAKVLKKGHYIRTYGTPVKIRGKKYYIIAKNRYVKIANVATRKVAKKLAKVEVVPTAASTSTINEKKIMHNSYLYDSQGKRANKLIFLAGSTVNTVGVKQVNGKNYYELENGLLIAAANIDGQKIKLKRNAYIYSQHGNRLGKKVLRKRKTVRVYGDPVKIGHKKYRIIANGKYVKQANLKK